MAGVNLYGELIRAQFENLSADPSAGLIARVYWNTATSRLKVDNGSSIQEVFIVGTGERLTLSAQTTTYSISATDDIVTGDATSASFTMTLPAASIGRKVYTIKKLLSDTSFNTVTVARAGSDTIDGGTSAVLRTRGESIRIVSDGTSAWRIVERVIPSVWTTFTPTGSWSSNTTYTGFWRRVGDCIELDLKIATSGAPTSASLTITLPGSQTVDTAKLTNAATTTIFGGGTVVDASPANEYAAYVRYNDTTSVGVNITDDAAAGVIYGAVTQSNPITFAASDYVVVRCGSIPITNW